VSTDALHLVGLKPSLGIHQREAGTRIHTQTQTRALTILFASHCISSSSLSFQFTYTADDQHATVNDGNARSHNAPALY
jgi:hypothetical protein